MFQSPRAEEDVSRGPRGATAPSGNDMSSSFRAECVLVGTRRARAPELKTSLDSSDERTTGDALDVGAATASPARKSWFPR